MNWADVPVSGVFLAGETVERRLAEALMKDHADDAGLAGKVAIVTGGGAAGDGIGNGRAAALLLARAGASVLVVDRDLALGERTVAMIEADGGTAVAHAADVTEEAACRAMVAAAL